MSFFNYNGKFYKENTPVITSASRGLKYGDGLFETIKMVNGKLLLKDLHFERLFYGMEILSFNTYPHFTKTFFEKEILNLAKKNSLHKSIRVRLMIFRGNGNIYQASDNDTNYIIETADLPITNALNSNGLIIDVYPTARKSVDILSNMKTNNFLPYALAAIYAKHNNLDDCVLLNTHERICDTTIANIFMVKDNIISTPPLTEGCIAGVMRRWILEKIKLLGYTLIEHPITSEYLKQADEVFLTNSISTLRWVKLFQKVEYGNDNTKVLYKALTQTFS